MESDGTESNEHCQVDRNAAIQKGYDNVLDQYDGFGR